MKSAFCAFFFLFFLLECDSNIYTTEGSYSWLICQFKVKVLWHTSWSDEAWQEIKVYLDAAVILLARRPFAAGSLHCKTLCSDHQQHPAHIYLHGLGFHKCSPTSMHQLKYCWLVSLHSWFWPSPSWNLWKVCGSKLTFGTGGCQMWLKTPAMLYPKR